MQQKSSSGWIPVAIATAFVFVGSTIAYKANGFLAVVRGVPLTVSPAGGVHFDRLTEGAIGEQVIHLSNSGSTPLRIERVASSCGCTSTSLPTPIPPHGQGEITVRYDSHERQGKINQAVSLYFFGYRAFPVSISVTGNVERDLVLSSPFIALAEGKGSVILERHDGKPLQVSAIDTPSALKLNLQPLSANAVRVDVSLTADATAGTHQEDLPLRVNHPGLPVLNVPVTWTLTGKYKVVPTVLNFGVTTLGVTKQGSVHFSGATVKHLQVTALPPGFTAHLTENGPEDATLKVNWSGKGGGRRLIHANITLSTGDAKEPRVLIPVYAAVNYTEGAGGCSAEKPCSATE